MEDQINKNGSNGQDVDDINDRINDVLGKDSELLNDDNKNAIDKQLKDGSAQLKDALNSKNRNGQGLGETMALEEDILKH